MRKRKPSDGSDSESRGQAPGGPEKRRNRIRVSELRVLVVAIVVSAEVPPRQRIINVILSFFAQQPSAPRYRPLPVLSGCNPDPDQQPQPPSTQDILTHSSSPSPILPNRRQHLFTTFLASILRHR